ncbi:hypothetical protein PUR61_05080 [Streptomyces sp. BE20]|nr:MULTISPECIES: hypothetical protein [unclassified Streptomyces]MED7951109.1 hypothetical protein [Streptomyces sp. BE303]MEE1821573.1 hypothetical protein [Streptomyces sp. BE20]
MIIRNPQLTVSAKAACGHRSTVPEDVRADAARGDADAHDLRVR